MTQPSAETITAELDAVHQRAHRAFTACDLDAYMAAFSPTPVYHQASGKSISRDDLARNVRAQFRRLNTAISTYRREKLELIGDEVREVLEQNAHASSTAFLVIHRVWDLRRKGVYKWRKGDHGWQITEVTILEDHLVSRGFTFGLHPTPVAGATEDEQPGTWKRVC